MRLNAIVLVCAVVAGLAEPALAADITQQGADNLKRDLTRLLPKDAQKNGSINVNPAGERYEIIYDLDKMLKTFGSHTGLSVSGLTPWSMFATPEDGGLWKLEGDNSLDVSGTIKAEGQPTTDFSYGINSYVFNALFDPAISYLRSGDFSTKAIRLTSKTEKEEVKVTAANSTTKLTSSDNEQAGRTNFAASGSMSQLLESVSGADMPLVEIRADALDFAAAVNGVAAKELREIVAFVLAHADDKKLRRADSEKLKSLLRDAFPLVTSLNETISFSNVTVSAKDGSGGAKSIDYNIAMAGPTNATRFDVGVTAQGITLDSALVPAAYSAFLPQSFSMQFSMPDMDFATFGDELLKMDFTKSKGSDEAGKKAFEKLFKDDNLVIGFPKISAVSSMYDVDLSGELRGHSTSQKEYSLDASIVARDFDKTITAIQDLAKTNPDLNQVSFGLMMAKGFAKTDTDGRQRWDINVAKDGAVTVNGQVVKGAD
ncbi:hypothetical protein ASE04_13090 [Rhizobium sp. Root708]|uniref:hypothetical protein n=1 Tax=Rhizobium sp. Root708 TaxID=1736592 RepID=UPI0006FD7741|nr:hypothetical protein [Rhizobium sp. Root708]KRB50850.1 hypothetical protein ASE04_13090 [Rhizobium sp. Root708]